MLLTYTSPPLTEALEITGTPVVRLEISSTHEDGVIIAYLESVSPDGKVTMLTEGELRLIHRKISDDVPHYPPFGPYHSFLRKDASPMIAGKMETVSFGLLPTSVLIPAGHSLRIALAGHDKDTFLRIPKTGDPVLTVGRNSGHASFIELPVVRVSIGGRTMGRSE